MDILNSVQSKTPGRWDLEGSFLFCIQREEGRTERMTEQEEKGQKGKEKDIEMKYKVAHIYEEHIRIFFHTCNLLKEGSFMVRVAKMEEIRLKSVVLPGIGYMTLGEKCLI